MYGSSAERHPSLLTRTDVTHIEHKWALTKASYQSIQKYEARNSEGDALLVRKWWIVEYGFLLRYHSLFSSFWKKQVDRINWTYLWCGLLQRPLVFIDSGVTIYAKDIIIIGKIFWKQYWSRRHTNILVTDQQYSVSNIALWSR